jgi:serine phosphatase RsbU (regulator of sigma subunit)/anti-sigma regulatory factor (Ser/Thr protein kinase)
MPVPAVGLALLLQLLVFPNSEAPFFFFYPAVVLSAWYGGFGPGLLAAVFSALAADYFLLEPRYSLSLANPTHWVALILFLIIGSFISLMYERLRITTLAENRVKDQLRRSNRALVALSNCNEALIHATDESALLQQICKLVVEKAGYRLCWVGYAEHDDAKTVRPVAQFGFDEDYLHTSNITWADTERGRGPTGTAIRTGQPAFCRNMATDPQFAPWRAEALKRGYSSSIAIPLMTDSITLGSFTIYASEPNAFGDDEVKLLTEMASDLAFGVVGLRTRAEWKKSVELEAAREEEVRIGFAIQQSLLLDPLPVDVPGLQFAALSVPSQRIDGDFYSLFKYENNCLDVIVADVMGKGVPAAILGAATKSHILRALCHLMSTVGSGELPEPKEIVTLAQAEMAQQLIDLESFVTLCYVRIDREKRILKLVDCGHTGLILRRAATGACEMIRGENVALGMRLGEIYEQVTVGIDQSDVLLLYSDGVTESRSPTGELFGQDRLVQLVQSNGERSPAALVKAIQQAAVEFSGSEVPRDDLTCVAISVVERELPLLRRETELRSELSELARARALVRSACLDSDSPRFDEDYIAQLELAVTEACSNIVKHAYRNRADQQIHLEVEVFTNKIVIGLHHLGMPFDPSKVPAPQFDGSQESGFGLYLIRQSVDDVRYYRDERGRNCIALIKNWNS